MSLEEKVVKLLHEQIGFNPESIGSEKMLSSVRETLKTRRIKDPEAFLNGLRQGNTEFHEIINAVVVPETWFFRDGAPFEFLKRHVKEAGLPGPGGVLRCLSVPCSTGEEPYSIAMALLDSGLSAQQFTIDAIDISSSALERGAAGNFGPYSFRGSDLGYRDRHFERHGKNYRLNANVRATVKFTRDNLLNPAFTRARPPYDIVFCRNLLIYFDASGWERAAATLHQLLKNSGILFMGHAELLSLRSKLFESIKVPQTFAYRKKLEARKSAMAAAVAAPPKDLVRPKAPPAKPRQRRTRTISKTPAPAGGAGSLDKLLDQATRLADQGELAQAADICKTCLKQDPASARSYVLLGLIAEAESKSAAAEDYYRRALYLDKQNYEAMVHLALLLDARGDASGEILRKRASNIRQQS